MQMTYWPVWPEPREPEPDTAEYVDAATCWGFSMHDVDGMAHAAVNTVLNRGSDYQDRFTAARDAIIDRLCEDQHNADRGQLIHAGRCGIHRMVRGVAHLYGWHRDLGRKAYAPRFEKYWLPFRFGVADHGSRVVDGLAVLQILSVLPPQEQRVLFALAMCDDYDLAADMLGMRYKTFTGQIVRARRRFYGLWHQGETPSRMWATDQRKKLRGGPPRKSRMPQRLAVDRRARAKDSAQ